MLTEENKKIEKIATIIGYLVSYFLFTTILFIILILLKKIPEVWSYYHIMGTEIDYLVMDKFLIKREDNPKDMWNNESLAKD